MDPVTPWLPTENHGLRVLRLCSVFMPPDAALRGRGRRFDPVGGMQNHTLELTKALDQLGVRQTVLTTRPPGSPNRQLVGDSLVLRVGLPVRRFRQLFGLEAVRVAPTLARRADVIHAHLGEDLAVLPIATGAARRFGIPLVVTVHCSLGHTLAATNLRGLVLRVIGGAVERALLPRADAVVTLTNRLAAALSSSGVSTERIHVVPPGVDHDLFAAAGNDPFADFGRPRLVFVGRLTKSKGVHVLLDAAVRLGSRCPPILFVGDGPERDALQRRIRLHRLSDRVHLTGFLPHDLIPAVLTHADGIVLPSLYEELGSVLLEAASVGLPVIASDVGGVREIVSHEDNGLLVPPRRPGELALAIARLARDQRLRETMTASQRRRASGHDWNEVARSMLEIYRATLPSTVADDAVGLAATSSH